MNNRENTLKNLRDLILIQEQIEKCESILRDNSLLPKKAKRSLESLMNDVWGEIDDIKTDFLDILGLAGPEISSLPNIDISPLTKLIK